MTRDIEHQVVVGNIGTVYCGDNHVIAGETYETYVRESQSGKGLAGGELVTWMRDGDIYREHES